MTRQDFLNEFLGAFGAKNLIFSELGEDRVIGTVVFDLNDPAEQQGFCWHRERSDIPSEEIYNLVRLINEQKLLNIDRIIVSRDELRTRYNDRWNQQLSLGDFNRVMDELESIEVCMVDDGEEPDMFLIHE